MTVRHPISHRQAHWGADRASHLLTATMTNARMKIPPRTTGDVPDQAASVTAVVSVGGSDGAAIGVAFGAPLAMGVGVGPVLGVGDGVGLLVGLGDGVGLLVGLGDGVGTAVAQVGLVMVSLIKVTSPFRASARPSTFTPLAIVIEVNARIDPTKVEPEPSVAELAICQKTLHELAPLMSLTELDDAVIRDEAA